MVGYITEWGPDTIDRIVKLCIDALVKDGKLMFSAAYMPQSIYRNAEKRAMFHNNPELAERWYREMCKRLTNVWHIRDNIARLARETKSWKNVVECLAKCAWFGGSMFHSKEAVQDMLHTYVLCVMVHSFPLNPTKYTLKYRFVFQRFDKDKETWICDCIDQDLYCPVGPGARRGLNRLAGRPVAHKIEKTKEIDEFPVEMMNLFQEVKKLWPDTILGIKSVTLHLHDIQFQLCEFDKYSRVVNGYKKGKRYVHHMEIKQIAHKQDSEAAAIYKKRKEILDARKKRKRQKLEAQQEMEAQRKAMEAQRAKLRSRVPTPLIF